MSSSRGAAFQVPRDPNCDAGDAREGAASLTTQRRRAHESRRRARSRTCGCATPAYSAAAGCRLSGDLDWIVLKALEKDRNRRYAIAVGTWRLIFAAIWRMRPFSPGRPLPHTGCASSPCVIASALVLLCGVGHRIAVFGVMMACQAHEIAMQRDEARFQAHRAEASSEFMSLMLEEVGPGGRPLRPVELVDRGVALLDKRYGADPRFAARMLLQLSRRYMDLSSTQKQNEVLARALAIANELDDADLIANVECTMAAAELEANRYEQATSHFERGQQALNRLKNPPVATRVDCLRAQSAIAELQRDFTAASSHLRTAQRLLEDEHITRGLQYHAVLTDLGGIYFRTSRYRDALELNQLTADALDRNGRGGTLGRVIVAANRATILFRMGEVRAAEAAGREALARAEQLRGDQPPAPAQVINYATTLLRLNRIEEATQRLTVAQAQAESLGSGFWATIANYQWGRAQMYAGNSVAAASAFEATQRAWEVNETANKDRLAELTKTMAELALRDGRMQEAPEPHRFCIGAVRISRWKHRSRLVRSAHDGRTHLSAARPACKGGIVRDCRCTNRGSDRSCPSRSADVGEGLLVLAQIKHVMGQQSAAVMDARRASEALEHALGVEHPAHARSGADGIHVRWVESTTR